MSKSYIEQLKVKYATEKDMLRLVEQAAYSKYQPGQIIMLKAKENTMTKTLHIYDVANPNGAMNMVEKGVKQLTFESLEHVNAHIARLRKKPKVRKYTVTITLTEEEDENN